MNNKTNTLFTLIFVLTIFTGIYADEIINKTMIVKAKSGLIMREQPDVSSKKISMIPFGDEITVLDKKSEITIINGTAGNWMLVKWKEKTAWVFGGYLVEKTIVTVKNADKKNSVYKWNEHGCEFEGIYNNTVITEMLINNCYEISGFRDNNKSITSLNQNNSYGIFKQSDIDKVNVDLLDKEYQFKHKKLSSIDLPKIKFWENRRKNLLIQLEDEYHLYRAYLLGFKDPKNLRDFKKSNPELEKYTNVLIANDESLFKTWHDMVKDSMKTNNNILKRYNNELSSKEKLFYARKYVINFGWYNTANKLRYHLPVQPVHEEFLKLFLSTKLIDCLDD